VGAPLCQDEKIQVDSAIKHVVSGQRESGTSI